MPPLTGERTKTDKATGRVTKRRKDPRSAKDERAGWAKGKVRKGKVRGSKEWVTGPRESGKGESWGSSTREATSRRIGCICQKEGARDFRCKTGDNKWSWVNWQYATKSWGRTAPDGSAKIYRPCPIRWNWNLRQRHPRRDGIEEAKNRLARSKGKADRRAQGDK